MKRYLPVVAVLLAMAGTASARGLLIPEEKSVPPLAMLNHKVTIDVDDQVAVTKVEQTFRNHTNRPLEATYIFPVPRGASVNKFTMLVNGTEVKGELVEAKKAREIYTSIVQRTRDPGLLEYIGTNLLQMKAFPIPANADQKVTFSYTCVAQKDGDLVEYIYPLKTDGKAISTLESFGIEATIKSQHAVQNVYSPTHAITLKRKTDKEVTVQFDRNQGLLDKDFQLYYQLGDKDVGLTALTHRPIAGEPGYFMALITPKVEMKKEYKVPRDMVLVLDTSGSMRGVKMEQAKKALKYCLANLEKEDRFALINFATTVNQYKEGLVEANSDQLAAGRKWVDNLEATGGTAINDALAAAQALRSKDPARMFTIVFFTDGEPTIGETNIDKILKNAFGRNTNNTRIFTFGVGNDVNASFLDQLAEGTRALSTYVRPEEDIEAKVSGLYAKISQPVLTNLKLVTTAEVSLQEIYPAQLPDLFHGQQLVVLGRYTGKGASALKLTGTVGMDTKEFVYELTFPDRTDDQKSFVEEIWARRKVGYLLDQIRANGEKKELVDEVVVLAKKYGITTPFTSWLIVPDGAVPVTAAPGGGGKPHVGFGTGGGTPVGLAGKPGGPAAKVADFAKQMQSKPGELAANRGGWTEKQLEQLADDKNLDKDTRQLLAEARDKKATYDRNRAALAKGDQNSVQAGKDGVDLAIYNCNLRSQSRLEQTAQRNVYGRNCLEVGGVWIDEKFDAKTPTVVVKAQSEAYFKILEAEPKMKDVFRLGNHLVWMAPNGKALVIDANDGQEKLSDEEIKGLFVAKK
jgi:Ca-activated chloride channel family protein